MSHIVYDTKDIYIIPKGPNGPRGPNKNPVKPNHKKLYDAATDEDEPKQPKIISKQLSQQIQQKRCEKKLTQKELAQKLNVKVDVIQKYENGTAIIDHVLLNRIKRLLSI